MEKDKRLAATARLLEVMNTLRRECPWDREQTFDSLRSNTIEETYELADAITDHNMEGIKEELGDLLFAAVNAARFLSADPEDALQAACDKFAARFRLVEAQVLASGRKMDQLSVDELERIWDRVKHTQPEA